MSLHRFLILVRMFAMLAFVPTALAGDPVADQIARLRAQREKAISEALAKANADYGKNLDKLKALYSSKPEAVALVAREKEELAKVSLVSVPPVVKITAELAVTPIPESARPRVSIQKPDDLARFLIGTRWNYYNNDKFLGDARIFEFTGPETGKIDDKEITWKAVDKTKIWVSENREYSFNKLYTEFIGGWVPNPNDRHSARITN